MLQHTKSSKKTIANKKEQVRIRDKGDVCRSMMQAFLKNSGQDYSMTQLVLLGIKELNRELARSKGAKEEEAFFQRISKSIQELKQLAKD